MPIAGSSTNGGKGKGRERRRGRDKRRSPNSSLHHRASITAPSVLPNPFPFPLLQHKNRVSF